MNISYAGRKDSRRKDVGIFMTFFVLTFVLTGKRRFSLVSPFFSFVASNVHWGLFKCYELNLIELIGWLDDRV